MEQDRCVLPAGPAWGWAVQLYAARSNASWGIGDLADLSRIGRWSAQELDAGFVMINPLHAALPGHPQEPSPYYPSSRRFRNPLYLRVENVPGAGDLDPELDRLARAGRKLNAARRIDRDAVWCLKDEALVVLWDRFQGDAAFDLYCDEQGDPLERFATFCALSELHGRPWRNWPDDLRQPDASGVSTFRESHRHRIDYHRWLQWLLDTQLAAAAAEIPIVGDLAIGFHPDGADAWEFQDVLAPGVSVGAPPDTFSAAGQDWGLPPFDPQRLQDVNFGPFVETLQGAFRHAGGLRIDHVMGMFRLFWVPHGGSPADGAYVRYPSAALLDLLAAESQRTGAYVVGEDLGTVERGVREELAARRVLSYRLFWFEAGAPSDYPRQALAAISTHDLPTIAGVWAGTDPAAAQLRSRLLGLPGVDEETTVGQVVERTYAALAAAPSVLLAASLDDGLAVAERPNMPGTTEDANWSLALPLPLEDLESDQRLRRVAQHLQRRTLA